MFKVTKKPKTPNTVWDAATNRKLCKFVNGAFTTNEEAVALKLKELGYQVEGKADEKPIEKMKTEELKAYASEHNISLGEASSKTEILKVIQESKGKEQE